MNQTVYWKLNNLFEIEYFLVFCISKRLFVSLYSPKLEQLTWPTKKHKPFWWESEKRMAVNTMVNACTTAPIFRPFNYCRVVIETAESNYVSTDVCWQYNDCRVSYQAAYCSKTHMLAECNENIYGKLCMTIVEALEGWGPECTGAEYCTQLPMADRSIR